MQFSTSRTLAVLTVWLLIVAGLVAPSGAEAQVGHRCFSETGFCIEGRFREYWERHGGLPVFGFPIGPERRELNAETGQTYRTQWFERNRFELHVENKAPYDVLLGRLGNDSLARQERDWLAFPKANPSQPHFFPETGHAIAQEFWSFWSNHGLEFDGRRGVSTVEAIALFGMPISPPQDERNVADGRIYKVQWFERARFEWHPENPEPGRVLLGLLGGELHGREALYEDFEDGSRLVWWSPDPASFILRPSEQFASSGRSSLEVGYKKATSYQFFAAELPPGWRDLRSFHTVQLMVRGSATLLLKLEDEQGRQQDIATATPVGSSDWSLLRFDLSTADGAVNLAEIKNLFFFPAPGDAAAAGTLYVDDLTFVLTP